MHLFCPDVPGVITSSPCRLGGVYPISSFVDKLVDALTSASIPFSAMAMTMTMMMMMMMVTMEDSDHR